jgi:N-acetylglutamate synthase
MREKPQPVDALARAQVGQRWLVRRRLPGGSATDVIGWVERVEPEAIVLSTSRGEVVQVPVREIITARRAPAAAGGPGPFRTTAEELERYALTGWLARSEPLGEWTLRAGGGFSGRANSCLAVGDPGISVAEAAARIVGFSAAHGIDPWAQVIAGFDTEADLRKLGWTDIYVETDVLVSRLGDFLGESLPDPSVEITEFLTAQWMKAHQHSRPNDADPAILKMILAGSAPTAFAGIAAGQTRLVAIGRGHVSGSWLGLSSIWTEHDHRRQGLTRKIMTVLGHWAARQGARNVYLPVASDNDAALEAYTRFGFVSHHRYRYLAAPAGPSTSSGRVNG